MSANKLSTEWNLNAILSFMNHGRCWRCIECSSVLSSNNFSQRKQLALHDSAITNPTHMDGENILVSYLILETLLVFLFCYSYCCRSSIDVLAEYRKCTSTEMLIKRYIAEVICVQNLFYAHKDKTYVNKIASGISRNITHSFFE